MYVVIAYCIPLYLLIPLVKKHYFFKIDNAFHFNPNGNI